MERCAVCIFQKHFPEWPAKNRFGQYVSSYSHACFELAEVWVVMTGTCKHSPRKDGKRAGWRKGKTGAKEIFAIFECFQVSARKASEFLKI